MKPGSIQVFDGLRLTTQHLEHLQGGVHSAVQDLRQIMGLGQVHQGFKVVPAGDRMITVMPGIAFDFQKNRIVCDEPRTLEVKFAPGETLKFVCVKYEQVQNGVVDGRPTMIWDSCSMNLRATKPGAEENEVALCALKPDKKEGFTLISLSPLAIPENEKMARVNRELEDAGGEGKGGGAGLSVRGAESVPRISTEGGSLNTEPPAGEAIPETPGSGSIARQEKAQTLIEGSATSRSPLAGKMTVKQGVVRLAGEAGENLQAMLLEMLQVKPTGGGTPAAGGDFRLHLAGKEIPLDFPPLSLSCQTILRVSVTRKTGELSEDSLDFQATAQGEATFSDRLICQQAVSIMQKSCEKGGSAPGWAADLTDIGIAHLSFALLKKNAVDQDCHELFAILDQLTLTVILVAVPASGLQVAAQLIWQGQPNLEAIKNLPFQLSWQSQHVWKAIGSQSL